MARAELREVRLEPGTLDAEAELRNSNAFEVLSARRVGPNELDRILHLIPYPEGVDVKNPLPEWVRLPLCSKIPFVKAPKDYTVYTRGKLGQSVRREGDTFDLSDPYNYNLQMEYDPIHDKHLKHLFSSPGNRRILEDMDLITKNNEVKCNLKNYNAYRTYVYNIHKNSVLNALRKSEEIEGDQAIARSFMKKAADMRNSQFKIEKTRKQVARRNAQRKIKEICKKLWMDNKLKKNELAEQRVKKMREERQLKFLVSKKMFEEEMDNYKLKSNKVAWHRNVRAQKKLKKIAEHEEYRKNVTNKIEKTKKLMEVVENWIKKEIGQLKARDRDLNIYRNFEKFSNRRRAARDRNFRIIHEENQRRLEEIKKHGPTPQRILDKKAVCKSTGDALIGKRIIPPRMDRTTYEKPKIMEIMRKAIKDDNPLAKKYWAAQLMRCRTSNEITQRILQCCYIRAMQKYLRCAIYRYLPITITELKHVIVLFEEDMDRRYCTVDEIRRFTKSFVGQRKGPMFRTPEYLTSCGYIGRLKRKVYKTTRNGEPDSNDEWDSKVQFNDNPESAIRSTEKEVRETAEGKGGKAFKPPEKPKSKLQKTTSVLKSCPYKSQKAEDEGLPCCDKALVRECRCNRPKKNIKFEESLNPSYKIELSPQSTRGSMVTFGPKKVIPYTLELPKQPSDVEVFLEVAPSKLSDDYFSTTTANDVEAKRGIGPHESVRERERKSHKKTSGNKSKPRQTTATRTSKKMSARPTNIPSIDYKNSSVIVARLVEEVNGRAPRSRSQTKDQCPPSDSLSSDQGTAKSETEKCSLKKDGTQKKTETKEVAETEQQPPVEQKKDSTAASEGEGRETVTKARKETQKTSKTEFVAPKGAADRTGSGPTQNVLSPSMLFQNPSEFVIDPHKRGTQLRMCSLETSLNGCPVDAGIPRQSHGGKLFVLRQILEPDYKFGQGNGVLKHVDYNAPETCILVPKMLKEYKLNDLNDLKKFMELQESLKDCEALAAVKTEKYPETATGPSRNLENIGNLNKYSEIIVPKIESKICKQIVSKKKRKQSKAGSDDEISFDENRAKLEGKLYQSRPSSPEKKTAQSLTRLLTEAVPEVRKVYKDMYESCWPQGAGPSVQQAMVPKRKGSPKKGKQAAKKRFSTTEDLIAAANYYKERRVTGDPGVRQGAEKDESVCLSGSSVDTELPVPRHYKFNVLQPSLFRPNEASLCQICNVCPLAEEVNVKQLLVCARCGACIHDFIDFENSEDDSSSDGKRDRKDLLHQTPHPPVKEVETINYMDGDEVREYFHEKKKKIFQSYANLKAVFGYDFDPDKFIYFIHDDNEYICWSDVLKKRYPAKPFPPNLEKLKALTKRKVKISDIKNYKDPKEILGNKAAEGYEKYQSAREPDEDDGNEFKWNCVPKKYEKLFSTTSKPANIPTTTLKPIKGRRPTPMPSTTDIIAGILEDKCGNILDAKTEIKKARGESDIIKAKIDSIVRAMMNAATNMCILKMKDGYPNLSDMVAKEKKTYHYVPTGWRQYFAESLVEGLATLAYSSPLKTLNMSRMEPLLDILLSYVLDPVKHPLIFPRSTDELLWGRPQERQAGSPSIRPNLISQIRGTGVVLADPVSDEPLPTESDSVVSW